MLYSAVLFIILFATWLILSGFTAPLFLALAAFSCALAVWARVRMHIELPTRPVLANLIHLPVYLLWLIKEIYTSTFNVVALVWKPNANIKPCFAWIPTAQHSDINKTIYANSITLTPGTVTVTVRGNQLGVHALEASSLEDLREGSMDRKILKHMREA